VTAADGDGRSSGLPRSPSIRGAADIQQTGGRSKSSRTLYQIRWCRRRSVAHRLRIASSSCSASPSEAGLRSSNSGSIIASKETGITKGTKSYNANEILCVSVSLC